MYLTAAALTALATIGNVTPEDFDQWKSEHGKNYVGGEHDARLGIFRENAQIVEQHNAGNNTWAMSLNEYADLSAEEFNDFYLGFNPSSKLGSTDKVSLHTPVGDAPASVDWRTDAGGKMVGPVKNQGSCGSCWAFSTIASVEGQVANATGTYVSLSEQNLVDCVKNEPVSYDPTTCCSGCQGGLMDNAFSYVVEKQSGGVDTESSYKYKGSNGKCGFDKSNVGGTITGYKDVRAPSKTAATAADEANVKNAVATVGPLSIAVDASKGWQLYHSGIFSGKGLFGSCKSDPAKADHGVAVVGYGTDNGDDYWIVRNSWGATWGEKGYMKLPMGKNTCGIANFATYPTVTKKN